MSCWLETFSARRNNQQVNAIRGALALYAGRIRPDWSRRPQPLPAVSIGVRCGVCRGHDDPWPFLISVVCPFRRI